MSATVRWRFHVLGGLRIECDGAAIDLPPYRCQRALIYLLLHVGRPVRRERLVGELYPDLPPQRARTRLSDHLWLLRAALPGFTIDSDGDAVEIPAASVWVDCAAFAADVATNDTEAMFAAVVAYTGDLAPDLYDDWVLLAREHLRNAYLNALLTLAARFEKAGQHQRSTEVLERLLVEAPFDEAAVRQLMRAYVRLGRRGLAISTFEKYRLLWLEQLNLQPERETQILYDSIAAGVALPTVPAEAAGLPERDPAACLQQAEVALHEGDRARMRALLRAASATGDPALALQRDLLAIDEALAWGDLPRAEQLLAALDGRSGPVDLRRAALWLAQHDNAAAHAALQRVLQVSANTNDRELEAVALSHLAAVKLRRGEMQDAFLAVDRAIHLGSQLDRSALLIEFMLQKAEILHRQGANHDARQVLFQAQSLAESRQFKRLLAEIDYMLGSTSMRVGRYLDAYTVMAHGLETARNLGLRPLESRLLVLMSAVCDFLGRKEEAVQLLSSAREIRRMLNDPVGLAIVDYNMAAALPYHDESRCAEAANLAREALAVFEAAGRQEWQAVAHTALAYALWVDGHHQEAIGHYQRSIELHRALGESLYIAELYAYAGLAALGLGDVATALEWTEVACYEQALRTHSDIVTDIFYARGAALERSGNMEEALCFYSRAYQTLLDFAQEIEDDGARQAYFHRDPTTRRLMQKVTSLGLAPRARPIVIRRSLPGPSPAQVELRLTVDAGAPDQALMQGKGNAALRRVRLQRLLRQAGRQQSGLTLAELARVLQVSKRTVQRDMQLIRAEPRT